MLQGVYSRGQHLYFCLTLLHLLYFVCCAETMSVQPHMREAPSMPFTERLGSSSNQSAIRQRLLWATENSDYPRVTGGIFSISAPFPPWLARCPGATEWAGAWWRHWKAGRAGGRAGLGWSARSAWLEWLQQSSNIVNLIQTFIIQLPRVWWASKITHILNLSACSSSLFPRLLIVFVRVRLVYWLAQKEGQYYVLPILCTAQ